MTNWVEGKVVENVRWHDRLFSLRVDAELASFVAGQFTKLALAVGDKRLGRAYSFVNSPEQSIHEFYYVSVEDGGLSPLLAQLQVGDRVLVSEQPSGFFTLDDVSSAKELWLLSTGTAIGPYLSMLNTPELLQRFDTIVLVHCVRHLQDLSYRTAINELLAQFESRLVYLPMVTREKQQGRLAERIPAAIANGELSRHAKVKLDPKSSQVMICGNPEMVRETRDLLLTLGFTKNLRRTPGNISVENYW